MRSRAGIPNDVRRTTWCAFGALGMLATVAPRLARAVVFGLTATIGLAHGATDASNLDRLGIRPRGGRATISVVYGILAIGVYATARRYPAMATRSLGIVSWAHFGSGDAAFARACGSRRFEIAESFVRGGVPLTIGGRDARSAWATIVACAFAGLSAADDDLADAIDVALPALLLYAAPPRLGFGCYFAAWHSPRHLALLLERDPRGGTAFERFRRFVREAAPNSAIAAAFGALAYILRGDGEGVDDLAHAAILAITVPHQIAVWTAELASRRA